MRVVVTTEHRFDITPDGQAWTASAFPYDFWLRYLDVFEQVRVLGRGRSVASVPPSYTKAAGPGVEFYSLPYYQGPSQFVQTVGRVVRVLNNSIAREDSVILRVPSILADILAVKLRLMRHPYAVEVCGDPWDVFAPGVIRVPLRPVLRFSLSYAQKLLCAKAGAASYVTQNTLQRRYPCKAFETSVSDVQIDEVRALARGSGMAGRGYSRDSERQSGNMPQNAQVGQHPRALQLITVGTLEQLYKGPDILLQAMATCISRDLKLELVIVGDGTYRRDLESLALRLGVADRTTFLGALPAGQAVQDQLDKADVFVLPSRTEGLPRAMIEAMARGLPCIGSSVGGIPELLPPEDMVPPEDPEMLARKLEDITTNPQRMARMSERNINVARSYLPGVLRGRRTDFYRLIRQVTEAWLVGRSIAPRTPEGPWAS